MSGLAGALAGSRVALLEARLPSALATLIEQYGGEPYCVPAVREAPRDCRTEIAQLIDELGHGSCRIVIFFTGAGATLLFEEAKRLGRLPELVAGLRGATTVCRGPKPSAALRQYSVPVTLSTGAPYTTAEILELLAQLTLRDAGVALVHYGERNEVVAAALRDGGARVRELQPYEWLMPEDLVPLQGLVRAILANQVHVIVFTSQIQVRHLLRVATDLGCLPELVYALNARLVVASVGPVCSAVLESFGVVPRVTPQHPKLRPMVHALAEYVQRHDRRSGTAHAQ
jgi:uroporphyrinogen-III synthase